MLLSIRCARTLKWRSKGDIQVNWAIIVSFTVQTVYCQIACVTKFVSSASIRVNGCLAVVSIHPIEVVADPSVAGLVSIRILVMLFCMPTVHHTDRLTSSALH